MQCEPNIEGFLSLQARASSTKENKAAFPTVAISVRFIVLLLSDNSRETTISKF